jgi:hypothetical protein
MTLRKDWTKVARKIELVERRLDGKFEFDLALDGELQLVETSLWQGAKSGLYFYNDEAFNMSGPYLTFDEVRQACALYCRHMLAPYAEGGDTMK